MLLAMVLYFLVSSKSFNDDHAAGVPKQRNPRSISNSATDTSTTLFSPETVSSRDKQLRTTRPRHESTRNQTGPPVVTESGNHIMTDQRSTGDDFQEHSFNPTPKLDQVGSTFSMLYLQRELMLLNVTVNTPFCARLKDSLTYDVVLVTCFCDDLCNVFGDCCWPYDRFCNDTRITGFEIQRNYTKCWLQASREYADDDSKFYWVVSSCPSHWSDEAVRKKCEFNGWSTDINVLLPVSSTKANVTFKNAFCAECHKAMSHKAWKPKIVCQKSQIEVFKDVKTVAGLLEKIHLTPDCMVLFDAPEQHPGRPCIGPGGVHEPLSGTVDGICPNRADAESSRLCNFGPVSVTYFAGPHGYSYGRNIYCWLCRLPRITIPSIQKCNENDELERKGFEPQGLSALIDYHREARCQETWTRDACKQSEECPTDEKWCSLPLDLIINLTFKLTFQLSPKEPIKRPCEFLALCTIGFKFLSGGDLSSFSPRGAWVASEQGIEDNWCTLPRDEMGNITITIPIRLKQGVHRVSDADQLFEGFVDEVKVKSHRQISYKINFGVSVMRYPNSLGAISSGKKSTGIPTSLSPVQGNLMFWQALIAIFINYVYI